MIPVIDLHCDTIPALYHLSGEGRTAGLEKNQLQIDLNKLAEGGYLCQCFSLFTDLKTLQDRRIRPQAHVQQLISFWKAAVEAFPERILPAVTAGEILENQASGKVSAVMTVEEGGVYEGKLENLYRMYDQGVRISTVTWNYPNELGFPNPAFLPGQPWEPDLQNGLTETGIAFVEEMERLGILVDLSHLNDAGIRDVFLHTRGPVIATHSNARTLCGHLRNLPDAYIRTIAERGGVIGINFYPRFVLPQALSHADDMAFPVSCRDLVGHMKHLRNLGGIDCIAFGSDFDGFQGRTEAAHAGDMQRFADAMHQEGFSDSEIEKVFYRNALRVFSDTWRS